MSLFKHAMVSGINDALVDRGIVSWPNEAVGFDVCSKVAADLDGPDMLPEGGLAKESAVMIATRLKEASDTLVANGYGPDAGMVLRTKQAAAMDFETRAAILAEACMTKAAEDASLTDVGTNTEESAASDEQVAELDLKNRPANKYLTGVGRTMFPSGGVVGQQMVHPERQAGPAISNSLTSLDKQAFAVTPEGHRYDADMARLMADMLAKKHEIQGEYGAEAPTRALLMADPLNRLMEEAQKRHSAYTARQHDVGENAYNPLGGILTPYESKTANEDMSASDLAASDMTPGATPGALQRAMLFLQALKNKGVDAGPAAQVAAAGLGEAGGPGMEVMAHVLDTVKTAADADEVIEQILQHQGEAGQLASPELVDAIEQMMAEQGEGDEDEDEMPKSAADVKLKVKGLDFLQKNRKTLRRVKEVGQAVGTIGGMVAGGKMMMDDAEKAKKKKEEEKAQKGEEASKSASLLAYLKAAADGSLTDVQENTPESAEEQVAKLDQANRSTSEYLIGQGGMSRLPNKGQVYAVEPAPKQDAVPTDTVASREIKSAEDAAYVQNFRKIANELGPYLPATMPRQTKVAHLQAMLGMPPSERVAYLNSIRVG
jgi:hypothetical protein